MHAVWLENQVLSFRKDVPEPEPVEGEALVKVRLAGICGTDLELVKGYYPFTGIPGHEFVGEIVRALQEPQRRGQRVVGQINLSCGSCPSCLAGRICRSIFHLWWSMRSPWWGRAAVRLHRRLINSKSSWWIPRCSSQSAIT